MDNGSLQLSFDLPKLTSPEVSIMEINDDALPLRDELKNFNESLDIWNILKKEERCDRHDCYNSKELFVSIQMQSEYSNKMPPEPVKGVEFLVDNYEKSKDKLSKKGVKPIEIVRIESDEEEVEQPQAMFRPPQHYQQQPLRKSLELEIRKLLPMNIEIPTEYLRGLISIHNQPQVKSARRIKVERYLEKRRLKTWNKKICYNCRQKVAEERLRVKGRFVARKKGLHFLKMEAAVKIEEDDR